MRTSYPDMVSLNKNPSDLNNLRRMERRERALFWAKNTGAKLLGNDMIEVWRANPSIHHNIIYEPGIYTVPANRDIEISCAAGYHFEPTAHRVNQQWLSSNGDYVRCTVFAEDVTVPNETFEKIVHHDNGGYVSDWENRSLKARCGTLIILDVISRWDYEYR